VVLCGGRPVWISDEQLEERFDVVPLHGDGASSCSDDDCYPNDGVSDDDY